MAKIYRGERTRDGVSVTVDGKPLNPRTDIRNHSPSGFDYGHGGSGAAQLALALLADVLDDEIQTQIFYQAFKWQVIVPIKGDRWTLTDKQIIETVDDIQSELEERRALHGVA